MFRLKISITHIVLVAVVAVTAHLMLTQTVGPSLEQNAEVSLRRAAVIAEQTKRLDHFALERKSELFASDGNLYKYMTLEDRPALFEQKREDIQRDLAQGDASPPKGADGDTQRDVDAENDDLVLSTEFVRHEIVHEQLRVGEIRLERFASEKDIQKARNIDLSLLKRRPVKPDLIMALDDKGKGVAALGKDRKAWYGDNVASDYPVVMEVLKNPKGATRLDVWRWSWSDADDPSTYLVALQPIQRWDANEAAGVIVTGYQIHDGSAQDIRRLLAGVTTREAKTGSEVSADVLEAAPHVAFFRGRKIISSTFSTTEQQTLGKTLFENEEILAENRPEKLVKFRFNDDPYYGFVRFFPGQFETESKSGIVILSNLAEAKEPVVTAYETTYWVAMAAILLGVLLIIIFYQQFIRPVGELEETIAEILSGNKDAEFVISGDEHPVFSSLVQGLNLVTAYLQGKPMPDDEEELEGWGDLVGGPGDEPPSDGGSDGPSDDGDGPTIQGVDMDKGD
jgi:hypothetical protein